VRDFAAGALRNLFDGEVLLQAAAGGAVVEALRLALLSAISS
jgi:hypothetical protein